MDSPNVCISRVTVQLVIIAMALSLAEVADARNIYVNHETGDDRAAGEMTSPYKTIHKGVRSALPGDTVHLVNTGRPYRESPVFHNAHGEPGKPITLDGHGATIEGSDPLAVGEWEQVSPGLYRKAKLLATNDAVIGRWFMRFAGKMQHMNRTSKGPTQPLKKPDELQAGEWTYVKDVDTFYVRIDPQSSLADAQISAPIRSSGVQVSGDCSHLVIRNLICTHVYNDGFNIHGKTRDVRFENVQAIECGDDGISAHDDCRIVVDGMVSIGNSTGMCHTNESHTDCRGVLIRDCLGMDYFMIGGGQHRLSDSLILVSSAGGVRIAGDSRTGAICDTTLEHVAIQRIAGSKTLNFAAGSAVTLKHVTSDGSFLAASGKSIALERCVIGSASAPELTIYANTTWQADHNVYDVKFLRFDKRFIAHDQFDAFQKEGTSDQHSQWTKVKFAEPFTGAMVEPALVNTGVDVTRLPKR